MPLRLIVLAMSAFLVAGVSPMPTPTPTVYAPTFTETLHRTLSSGAYGEPAGTSATGETADGFALSLTANRYRFKMGENLWFAVELRNVSGTSRSTSFSSKDSSYFFIITDVKSGIETFRQTTPNFGPPAGYKFAPETSLFLWFLPEVTNHIEESGQYTIQAEVTARGSTLRSNLVTLDILRSRDARPSFAPSDPSDKTPSGPVVSGAAVALSKYTPFYRLGSPMWVVVELRNLTPGPLAIYGTDPFSYAPELVDLGSRRSLVPFGWYERLDAFAGSFGSFDFPKGQSHFVAIRLDRLFDITAPGPYLFRVRFTARLRPESVNNPVSVALQSNALKIDVLPAWSPAKALSGSPTIYEGEPGENPAGPASHGFALALTADWTKTDLGASLFATVELRNVSGRVRNASFGSRGSDYHFQIVREQTGAVVQRDQKATVPGVSSQSPWASRSISPDTSLYRSFWLTRLYRFTEGGTYTVRAIGEPTIEGRHVVLESNPLEVTLATPPPTLSLPKGQRVLDYAIQTDRPVYTIGQPIHVRLTLTNRTTTPIAYNLNAPQPPCILMISNSRDGPVTSSRGGRGRSPLRAIMARGMLPSGVRDFGWENIGTWGYRLDQPGTYVITARPNIEGDIFTPSAIYPISGDNGRDAAPVTIRILSKEEARTRAPTTLDDPGLDARLHALMADFRRLRSSVGDFVDQLHRGIAFPRLASKNGDWRADQQELEHAITALPSFADQNSSYLLPTSNLLDATLELGIAGDCADRWRDSIKINTASHVADYFFNAVQSELSVGEARLTDTAYPPADTNGYCLY